MAASAVAMRLPPPGPGLGRQTPAAAGCGRQLRSSQAPAASHSLRFPNTPTCRLLGAGGKCCARYRPQHETSVINYM